MLQGGGTTDAPFPGEVQSFLDYLATSDDAAGFPPLRSSKKRGAEARKVRAPIGIDTLATNEPKHVLDWVMQPISYARHRFPPDIIRHHPACCLALPPVHIEPSGCRGSFG